MKTFALFALACLPLCCGPSFADEKKPASHGFTITETADEIQLSGGALDAAALSSSHQPSSSTSVGRVCSQVSLPAAGIIARFETIVCAYSSSDAQGIDDPVRMGCTVDCAGGGSAMRGVSVETRGATVGRDGTGGAASMYGSGMETGGA